VSNGRHYARDQPAVGRHSGVGAITAANGLVLFFFGGGVRGSGVWRGVDFSVFGGGGSFFVWGVFGLRRLSGVNLKAPFRKLHCATRYRRGPGGGWYPRRPAGEERTASNCSGS